MAAIAPTYLVGKSGGVSIDSVAQPVTQWKGTIAVGTFDATNVTTGGFAWPERTIKSLNGTCTILWLVTAGEPSFTVGNVYAFILKAQTGSTYTFNAMVVSADVSVDAKGGVMYDVAFQSQGTVTEATA